MTAVLPQPRIRKGLGVRRRRSSAESSVIRSWLVGEAHASTVGLERLAGISGAGMLCGIIQVVQRSYVTVTLV